MRVRSLDLHVGVLRVPGCDRILEDRRAAPRRGRHGLAHSECPCRPSTEGKLEHLVIMTSLEPPSPIMERCSTGQLFGKPIDR